MNDIAIALDTETLSLKPTAYVAQVGVAVANLTLGRVLYMPANFYVRDEDQVGRDIEPDTVRWWLHQNPAVIASVHNPVASVTMSAEDLYTRIHQLMQEFTQVDDRVTVWAGPAAFDLPLLKDLFGGKTPWHYRQERCFSTLWRTMDPEKKLAPPANELAHNAAADVDWMVRYLLRLWPALHLEVRT